MRRIEGILEENQSGVARNWCTQKRALNLWTSPSNSRNNVSPLHWIFGATAWVSPALMVLTGTKNVSFLRWNCVSFARFPMYVKLRWSLAIALQNAKLAELQRQLDRRCCSHFSFSLIVGERSNSIVNENANADRRQCGLRFTVPYFLFPVEQAICYMKMRMNSIWFLLNF